MISGGARSGIEQFVERVFGHHPPSSAAAVTAVAG